MAKMVLLMICTLILWLLLDITETRPILRSRKDTHAVSPSATNPGTYIPITENRPLLRSRKDTHAVSPSEINPVTYIPISVTRPIFRSRKHAVSPLKPNPGTYIPITVTRPIFRSRKDTHAVSPSAHNPGTYTPITLTRRLLRGPVIPSAINPGTYIPITVTRPIFRSRKDTHADYEVLPRPKAIDEQLRVFVLEIVKDSDGAKKDVSLRPEYQYSKETSTSTSRCQEEHMPNFIGNRVGSDGDEGEGEEEEGRNVGRGDGSGRRHGEGGGGGGGGGDGGGGGGGGGGDGDGEGGDVEGRGGDKKKLRSTPKILQLIAMSTIANTAQTFGSTISLKVGGLTFLTKILLILVMAITVAGYLCSIIAILLMHERPQFSRVLVWAGCAATTLGFLILIVAFVLEL